MKQGFLTLGVLVCIGAWSPASAHQVYKCWSRGSVLYTEQPCSKRIVNTDDAPVPQKPNQDGVDRRRLEQNRAIARAMRPQAGESAQQFETRRRRARLMQADRAECARRDTRIPVELARLKSADQEEVLQAEAALSDSRRRLRQMRC